MYVLLASLMIVLMSGYAFATPADFTYQGRILKKDGAPLTHHAVQFNFMIMDPSAQFVLWEELSHPVNMLHSNGVFEVSIGNGGRTYPDASLKDLDEIYWKNLTLLQSFSNQNNFFCKGSLIPNCYKPKAEDGRILRVQFWDGTSWNRINPDTQIRSVPFAGYAKSATQLENKKLNEFVLKESLPNCPADHSLRWNFAAGSFSCLAPAASTSFDLANKITSDSPYLTVSTGSLPTIDLNVGVGANKLVASDDSRLQNIVYQSQLQTALSGVLLQSDLAVLSTCASNQTLSFLSPTGFYCKDIVLNSDASFSGTLPISKGGTGATSVSAALNALLPDQVGQGGKVLTSNGTSAQWTAQGGVSSLSAAAGSPLAVTGTGNLSIDIPKAKADTNGYLSAADWVRFDGKMSSNTEISALSNLVTTGFIQRTGSAQYSTISPSAPLKITGLQLGVVLGEGLKLNADQALSIDFTTSNDSTKAVAGNDARLPSSACSAGSKSRWSGAAWLCEVEEKPTWKIVSTNYTATSGEQLFVDTSVAVLSIQLPANPKIGDTVTMLDVSGSFNLNSLQILRNGERIMGLEEDMSVSTVFASVKLIYSNATYGWRIQW